MPSVIVDEIEESKADTGVRFLSPSSTHGDIARVREEINMSRIQVGGDEVIH